MRYGEFELIADIVTDNTIEQIKKLKRPKTLKKRWWVRLTAKVCNVFVGLKKYFGGKVYTPNSLDDCTIGEILAMVNDLNALPYTACKIVLGLEPAEVRKESVEAVMGFTNFVTKELERILKIFESTRVEPDADERKAGVEELGKSVGLFGMIDYIAKRQHTSIEDAEKMKWKTVVALMIIDKGNAEYNRKLMDVRARKYKK